MSGYLDKQARATAERLLKKFGKKAIYVQNVEGAYDPNEGQNTVTETEHNITCYIDEEKAGNLRASGLIDATHLVVLVSAKELNLEVDNTDKLNIDGDEYTIIRDIPVWSGEEIALHNIVCKSS